MAGTTFMWFKRYKWVYNQRTPLSPVTCFPSPLATSAVHWESPGDFYASTTKMNIRPACFISQPFLKFPSLHFHCPCMAPQMLWTVACILLSAASQLTTFQPVFLLNFPLRIILHREESARDLSGLWGSEEFICCPLYLPVMHLAHNCSWLPPYPCPKLWTLYENLMKVHGLITHHTPFCLHILVYGPQVKNLCCHTKLLVTSCTCIVYDFPSPCCCSLCLGHSVLPFSLASPTQFWCLL